MIADLFKCIAILVLGFFAGLTMLNCVGGSNEAKKHMDISRPTHGRRTSGAELATKSLRVTCDVRTVGSNVYLVSLI
jgi:hypothetical protein